MMKKSRKGFTIVELVIVIAVIAVLAAVLIPTFIHLVNKANRASDESLVTNLNKALAMREQEPGDTKNNTMHDAVLDLEEEGYKLSQLLTKSDQKLLWNDQDNRFCLEDAAAQDKAVHYWQIVKEIPAEQKYSLYAGHEWEASEAKGLKVGFDAGFNTIQTVEYKRTGDAGQEVAIRTGAFDSNVTIDCEGSVKHYGKAGKLAVDKVAMSSFHEFGDVRTVAIKEGNFVIESSGNVTLVSVTATEAGKVKLDIQGDLEVLAGNTSNYTVTSGSAEEVVNAPIEDNTLAIVNGTAKTSLSSADFADGSKVVLLKDYYETTAVSLGSCTVVGNMTKLNATATGDKTIVLKNIHSTGLKVSNFTGTLTLDGGYLESATGGSGDSDAAIYINTGYGNYNFKNMTIATNITKGIKISKAASIAVENCDFDASRLTAIAQGRPSDIRSLSLIDIQEQNASEGQKMTVKIDGNRFASSIQGTVYFNMEDTDTAGAIKLKSEKQGFASVKITNNEFRDNYRDVVVGVNVMKSGTGFNGAKKPALLKNENNNIENSAIWTISGNKSNIEADKGVMIVATGNDAGTKAYSEKLGVMKGGCAVYNTYKSTKILGTETAWADLNADILAALA